jgi:hypothetical protein
MDDLKMIYDQKVEQLKKKFVTFFITIINFIGEKEFKKKLTRIEIQSLN